VTRIATAAILVIVIAAGASSSDAQTQRRPSPKLGQADQYEVTSQISEAMRYLTVDPKRSLTILTALDRRFPTNERVLTRLGYVWQVVGDVDSAEVYLHKALRVSPGSLEAGKSLGMLYLSQEREGEADAVFERLLRANGHGMSAYRAVGTALREAGRYDEALELYRGGRDRSPQHHVLSLEIADLLETVGDYDGALAEYLDYVGETGRNYRYAKTKILDLLRGLDEGERARLAQVLEARLDAGRGNRFVLLDVLASHYVEEGLLENALEKALLADKEGPSDGSTLISLSERVLTQAKVKPKADRRRYLELGIRSLDAFATNHPNAPGSDRVRFMLATVYERFGSGEVPGVTTGDRRNYLEQAVAEYGEVSRKYPNSEFAERAYLSRGDLLLHRLKRTEDALEAYRSGSVNSRQLTDAFAGRIGETYLGLGRFEDAEHYFESLINSGYPELAQAGTYYTGLRLCMVGNYEAARDTFTYLAEEVPSSQYTNDAIEAAWIVEEGMMFDSAALDTWFEVCRAEMVGDTATVLGKLDEVAAMPVRETLRPRSLFKMGTTLYHSGDLDSAVVVLDRFLDEYPEEDLRPDVQRQLAAIYEFGYEKFEKALREYEHVLLTYPDYAFLDEVRKDVRRLRYIVHGEEYEN
jgi:tetratricopeptide (TPR) repeat protein